MHFELLEIQKLKCISLASKEYQILREIRQEENVGLRTWVEKAFAFKRPIILLDFLEKK